MVDQNSDQNSDPSSDQNTDPNAVQGKGEGSEGERPEDEHADRALGGQQESQSDEQATLPPSQLPEKSKPSITANRIVLWVLVGGFGLYLIITGIVGMITKAR